MLLYGCENVFKKFYKGYIMKKIISLCLCFLLVGCYPSVSKKSEKNNEIDDFSILEENEILEFKIIDQKLISIYRKNNQIYLYEYSLNKKSITLHKKIYDDVVYRVKVQSLNKGYAIQIENILLIFENSKLIKKIALQRYVEDYDWDSVCISLNKKLIACMQYIQGEQVLKLIDLNNDTVENLMILETIPKKLNAIWKLAFCDQRHLIYCGGTYLQEGAQTTGCYGVIDIINKNYELYNSPAVSQSVFKNQILIHNQSEDTNQEAISLYYNNGFKNLSLSYSDSVNAYLSNGEIIILEKGSINEITPYVIFNHIKYDSFDLDNIYFCEYYAHKLFILGVKDGKNKIIERNVDE